MQTLLLISLIAVSPLILFPQIKIVPTKSGSSGLSRTDHTPVMATPLNKIYLIKLKYSDFKGHGSTAALTTTEINLIEKQKGGRYTFEVECLFIPEESWINIRTTEVLQHEQGHLDISLSFAKDIQVITEKFQHCDSLTAIAMRSYYDKQMIAWRKEQQEYDSCTRHGIDTTAQRTWQLRINQELKN